MEIMFEDLNPEAQKRLLEEAGVSAPEDMEWDDLPVAVVEFTEEFDVDEDDYADELDEMYEDDEYYD